jgi:GTP-binding protein
MFIDKATVEIKAGDGGNGIISWRHEKFIDRGGPDGGDGGNGGDVVLVASRNENTLATFRYQKELVAKSGDAGGKQKKHGRSAKPLLVKVPVGTVATNADGVQIADLTEDGQQVVVAHGGHGGFGNAHFVSSRRQAPSFAEKGEPGEELSAVLELKMIADVGLVGLPNAGKSTLLSRVSNARPEIADYPFTTLIPNLGVVDIDNSSLLFADIPGLIEGAAEGKGLGHDFLRHIERTAVIVHMIDAYDPDIAESYRVVAEELKRHDAVLAKRPVVVALNKTEGLDDETLANLTEQLRTVVPKKTEIFAISAQAGTNLQPFLYKVQKKVVDARTKAAKKTNSENPSGLPVITLAQDSADWRIDKSDGGYLITGKKLELFAVRTDFENEEGLERLRDILRKQGIMYELVRQGVKAGDTISFSNGKSFTY